MNQHLSFIDCGKAVGGNAKVRTGLGKSDCPGSQGGLRKRGQWRDSSVPAKVKRAVFLSRPSTVLRGAGADKEPL